MSSIYKPTIQIAEGQTVLTSNSDYPSITPVDGDNIYKVEVLANPNLALDFQHNLAHEINLNRFKALMEKVIGLTLLSKFSITYNNTDTLTISAGEVLYSSFRAKKLLPTTYNLSGNFSKDVYLVFSVDNNIGNVPTLVNGELKYPEGTLGANYYKYSFSFELYDTGSAVSLVPDTDVSIFPLIYRVKYASVSFDGTTYVSNYLYKELPKYLSSNDSVFSMADSVARLDYTDSNVKEVKSYNTQYYQNDVTFLQGTNFILTGYSGNPLKIVNSAASVVAIDTTLTVQSSSFSNGAESRYIGVGYLPIDFSIFNSNLPISSIEVSKVLFTNIDTYFGNELYKNSIILFIKSQSIPSTDITINDFSTQVVYKVGNEQFRTNSITQRKLSVPVYTDVYGKHSDVSAIESLFYTPPVINSFTIVNDANTMIVRDQNNSQIFGLSGNSFEYGAKIQQFKVSYTVSAGTLPVDSITVSVAGNVVDVTSSGNSSTYTFSTVNITQNTPVVLTVKDKSMGAIGGQTVTSTVYFTFRAKLYYGVGALVSNPVDSSFIAGLSGSFYSNTPSKVGLAFDMQNGYAYYAYPSVNFPSSSDTSSFATKSVLFKDVLFAVSGSWQLIQSNIVVVNQFALYVNYNLYKSPQGYFPVPNNNRIFDAI